MESREETISIMANAIAFELIEPHGEGDMSLEDRSRCLRAAERAYRQGIEREE